MSSDLLVKQGVNPVTPQQNKQDFLPNIDEQSSQSGQDLTIERVIAGQRGENLSELDKVRIENAIKMTEEMIKWQKEQIMVLNQQLQTNGSDDDQPSV